jgi:hypothetical protein
MNSIKMALLIGGLVAGSAQAATITAANGFGPVSGISSCKDVAKSADFTTGNLVSGGDWTGGCVGFYGVDVDLAAKTLTLTGLQIGNYESAFLDISGIVGTTISNFTAVGPNNLFNPTAYGNFAEAVPTPALSFTANSLRIEWTAFGGTFPNDQFAFGDTANNVAVFSFGVVPEPANWALLIAGFGLTGAAMRRKRAAVVAA